MPPEGNGPPQEQRESQRECDGCVRRLDEARQGSTAACAQAATSGIFRFSHTCQSSNGFSSSPRDNNTGGFTAALGASSSSVAALGAPSRRGGNRVSGGGAEVCRSSPPAHPTVAAAASSCCSSSASPLPWLPLRSARCGTVTSDHTAELRGHSRRHRLLHPPLDPDGVPRWGSLPPPPPPPPLLRGMLDGPVTPHHTRVPRQQLLCVRPPPPPPGCLLAGAAGSLLRCVAAARHSTATRAADNRRVHAAGLLSSLRHMGMGFECDTPTVATTGIVGPPRRCCVRLRFLWPAARLQGTRVAEPTPGALCLCAMRGLGCAA